METYNVIMLSILVMLIFGGIIWRVYSRYTTRKTLSFIYWKVQPGDVIVVESSDRYDAQIKYRREYVVLNKHGGSIHYKWRRVLDRPSSWYNKRVDWFEFAEEIGHETLTSKYGE